MIRVQVSSASGGSPIAYTFSVNPSFYDPKDEADVSDIEVLHGSRINQKRAWDDRPRIFRWEKYPIDSTNISSLMTYFRSVEGEIRYFNFNTIGDMNTRWPAAGDWKKARVISLKAEYASGGDLRYDVVELTIIPEQ